MYMRSYAIAMAMLLVFVGSPSYGQSPSCYDPMEVPGTCLPWGYTDLTSELGDASAASRHLIVDLSRDGSTLAGFALSPLKTFRWRLGEGVRVFDGSGAGISNPKLFLDSPVMSETGSFIAGDGLISGKSRVFRWDAEAGNTNVLVLPVGPAGEPSQPSVTDTPRINASMSGDGQTIVGQGEALFPNGSIFSPTYPFIWTNAAGTDGSSQQEFTFRFRPLAVDGIGSRVVGHEFTNPPVPATPESRAVFWTASGGGSVEGAFPESRFTASSYDGQILAGFRFDSVLERLVGFRWTSGGTQDITDFGFQPRAISDNGNVISGSTTFEVNSARLPFVRTEFFGAELLNDYLFLSYGLDGLKDPVTHLNDHAIVSGDGNVFTITGSQWVAKVSPIKAVSVGDSYSSGEGAVEDDDDDDAYGYEDGTDKFLGNKCHRSVVAYPALIKPRTSTFTIREIKDVPGTQFVWKFIACSGAQVKHFLTDEFYGEPPQLRLGGEVDLDTDLVTITIGGNDAQFGPVVNHCVRVDDCVDDPAPFDDAAGQTMRKYVPQLIENRVRDAVFAAYEQALFNAPEATVLVLGYPRLVSGNTFGCEETEFSPIGVTLASGLSEKEQRWIREMGDFLNKRLKQTAALIGVHFEEVVDRFDGGDGHNVCDSDPWITGVVENELVHSFHPTIRGQQAYSEVVNEFLAKSNPHGYFESGMPRNPPER
jgi:hypothetical protein